MRSDNPKSAGFSFGAIHAAMCKRAALRAEWLHALPEGDPMRVLARLQNTAACFLSRQSQADQIDMRSAISEAKQIEDAVFAAWLSDRGSKPNGEDREDGLRAEHESPGSASAEIAHPSAPPLHQRTNPHAD